MKSKQWVRGIYIYLEESDGIGYLSVMVAVGRANTRQDFLLRYFLHTFADYIT
jgi:hypothetical protein